MSLCTRISELPKKVSKSLRKAWPIDASDCFSLENLPKPKRKALRSQKTKRNGVGGWIVILINELFSIAKANIFVDLVRCKKVAFAFFPSGFSFDGENFLNYKFYFKKHKTR